MRASQPNSADSSKLNAANAGAAKLIAAHSAAHPLATLTDCLVDDNPAASARFDRGRRKALGASAIVQFFAVAALLIYPLFTTGSRLIAKPTVVIPPYGGMPHANRPLAQPQTVPSHGRVFRVITTGIQFHPPTNNRTRTSNTPDQPQNFGDTKPYVFGSGSDASGPGIPGLIDIPGAKSNTPLPPTPNTSAPVSKAPVSMSQGVVLASLIRRIEPVYPTIARQIHLEGVVELRAIIARDGTVQQLELVSGNPILAQAAREAVLQWRFRPTLLNGQPVEVITYFTVTFHLGQ
jgi:periplasmic protein TonB